MATTVIVRTDTKTIIHEEGSAYLDDEFGLVLAELWRIRWNLTQDQRDRVKAITQENYVSKDVGK